MCEVAERSPAPESFPLWNVLNMWLQIEIEIIYGMAVGNV